MKSAAPAAAAQPHHGIFEKSKAAIVVPPPAAAPPVVLPSVVPLLKMTGEVGTAATVKESEPEGAPPTAHCSDQEPISVVPTDPDFEKLPEPSVEPIGVFENAPPGPEPLTVTGEFGEAPMIATTQVSPT